MKKNIFKQVLSAMVLTMSLAGGAASFAGLSHPGHLLSGLFQRVAAFGSRRGARTAQGTLLAVPAAVGGCAHPAA